MKSSELKKAAKREVKMKKLTLVVLSVLFFCFSDSAIAGPPGSPPGPWKRGDDGSGNKQIEADLDNDGTAAVTIVDDGASNLTVGSLSVGATNLGTLSSTAETFSITVVNDDGKILGTILFNCSDWENCRWTLKALDDDVMESTAIVGDGGDE